MDNASVISRLPDTLRRLADVFLKAGFACCLVGGAVRSIVLDIEPKDWDLATDAHPQDVMRLFRRVIPTGLKHGTVTVLMRGERFEVTTFRIDGRYSDGRRPDHVRYASSLHDDLSRRDFTVNAMAIDLSSGEFVDPFDGRGDCRRRLIRAIGDPIERFNEDGLRILRAVRFSAQLGFSIDGPTRAGMAGCAANLRTISWERIRDEFNRILSAEEPSRYLSLMDELGILAIILPELARCKGIRQRANHDFDVFLHSLYACDGAPRERLELRYAALLHDLGKAETLAYDSDGFPTFHGHERSAVPGEILRRFKFPNEFQKKITHLIEQHMFNYSADWTDAAVRRFLNRVGLDHWQDLIDLRRADSYGLARRFSAHHALAELESRIRTEIGRRSAMGLKDLAVDGEDLMRELAVRPGPQIGMLLNLLLEAVLEDPLQNERAVLLEMARRMHGQRINLPR